MSETTRLAAGNIWNPTSVMRTLIPVSCVLSVAALYGALVHAPTVRIEGDVQRLMYVHVPAALVMYCAYTLVFVASLAYLYQRQARWDEVAAAAAEVGTVFATIMLLTGPIWARPVWGVWWVWDARLTSSLILWLIFVAYLMLRAQGGPDQQVARYCAVLGIIGFLDIPIIHYSVTWWRTLHPEPKIMTEGSIGLGVEPTMLAVLAISLAAAVTVFANLFTVRLQLERIARKLEGLHGSDPALPASQSSP